MLVIRKNETATEIGVLKKKTEKNQNKNLQRLKGYKGVSTRRSVCTCGEGKCYIYSFFFHSFVNKKAKNAGN